MSDKLGAVQAHIKGVESLEAVVGAMLGIAAAHSQAARQRIAGVRECAAIIGAAIGDALTLSDNTTEQSWTDTRNQAQLTIVFCAEQGFAGAFNDHVMTAASAKTSHLSEEYFIVGSRGMLLAEQHQLDVSWSSPMAMHTDEIGSLADHITEALYIQLNTAHFSKVRMVHAIPNGTAAIEVVESTLLPLDFERFAPENNRPPPLIALPIQKLLTKLGEEYVFTQLYEAIMLSFAAENDARMHTMMAARSNVRNTLDRLIGNFRRLRQEEITAEIVELSSGSIVTKSVSCSS